MPRAGFYARAYNNQSANVSSLLFGPKGQEPTDIPPVLASANFQIPGDGSVASQGPSRHFLCSRSEPAVCSLGRTWHKFNATLTPGECGPLGPLISNWCNNGPDALWCTVRCCAASGSRCSTGCAAGGDGRITWY